MRTPSMLRCMSLKLADFVVKVLEGFSDRRRSDYVSKMISRDTAVRIAIPRAAIMRIGNLFRGRRTGHTQALTDFYSKIGTRLKVVPAAFDGEF